MSEHITRPPDPALRALTRELQQARGSDLLKVVRLVDGMAVRGMADAIVAPLRPRLARLRPARPLTLTRLMFLPLDPVIVPAAKWRPEEAGIPRTVLVPIAATAGAAMAGIVGKVARLVDGRTTEDRDVVAEAGALLWGEAARSLAPAPAPVGWESTGLNAALYPRLARLVAALLAEAPALDELVAEPEPKPIIELLARVAKREPSALPTCLMNLLSRLPQAAAIVTAAASASGAAPEVKLRPALDQATELLVRQMELPGALAQEIAGVELAEAGEAVRRMDALLRQIESGSQGSGNQALARERFRGIRRQLDTLCRTRFAEALSEEFIRPLHHGPAGGAIGEELERTARGLRTLESEARGLGSARVYDKLLGEAAIAVQRAAPQAALSLIEQMRLVEILAGPEAALALWEAGH